MRVASALFILLLCHSVSAHALEFNSDVAPVIVKRCLECHNDREAAGGLVLTTLQRAMAGGDSGVVIVPKDVDASLLIERVRAGEMPPEKQGQSQQLPEGEIKLLRQWIAAGADWPEGRVLDLYEATSDVRGGRDWWSLQPVKRPAVPEVKQTSRVANSIDAFILARLETQEMQPAPLADKRTLIRRVYYDMLGLPPTQEQIEAFVADNSADAWETVVDTLLESPHYGERWARYWLDLVRFAETCGYERDQEKPYAWRYRDWVVAALNDDKPYDRFILEQLAGDELPDRSEETVVATGFLRLGTWNDEPNDPHEYKYERLEDMVHVTSSAFLGLTVKCARCHDHKFDPILQEDYYRMAAAFWAGPIEPGDRKLLGGPTKEQLGFENVFGWTDVSATPPPLKLLRKGNPKHPLHDVAPAHLSTIPAIHRQFETPVDGAKTTTRRLQLARWITDPANPLTARVFVNRMWQHHFGEGLVRSPNNFGFRGAPATHPELLDWLAAEFVDGGWKVKRLHKLILLSSTYRQSSLHPRHQEYSQRDYINESWWRANRRRLDAESLRDSMLLAAGGLDMRLGGPSFKPTISPEALEGLSRKTSAWTASPAEQQRRRSLYIYTKRGLLPPMMTTFDFSDTTLPCGQRDVTTVAPQALAMLNNAFTHQQSSALAARAIEAAGDSGAARVVAAWRFALGRAPTADELALASEHLRRQRARFAGQADKEHRDAQQLFDELPVSSGLRLHLRADLGVETADGRVAAWSDQSPAKHHAAQPDTDRRPTVVADAVNGQAAIRFDGKRRFMQVAGDVLQTQACTIVAVATDIGPARHREIISNWKGNAGNSTTSQFLGLTGQRTVRFSDSFGAAGEIVDPAMPFVLTASNGTSNAVVFQNTTQLASRGSPLGARKLQTPWVIGQQGNIDGEYWHGDIAEIVVYNRELTERERQQVWAYMMGRYGIDAVAPARQDPDLLALASLCHVLLNSNEFLYVD